ACPGVNPRADNESRLKPAGMGPASRLGTGHGAGTLTPPPPGHGLTAYTHLSRQPPSPPEHMPRRGDPDATHHRTKATAVAPSIAALWRRDGRPAIWNGSCRLAGGRRCR